MTEVLRQKLLSGNPLFGLETEGEITKRCGVVPASQGGVKKTCEITRLAHNAAVNHLRLRKYHKAALLPHTNTAVTPALLSSTVLERFNGVLDPDDRINGQVSLQLPNLILPLSGVVAENEAAATLSTMNPDGTFSAPAAGTTAVWALSKASPYPIGALFNNVFAGNLSLDQFYNAQTMDGFTRTMGEMVEADPIHGEENVLRWAHGLSLDQARDPFVIHEQRQQFGRQIVPAMDATGVANDTMRSDYMMQMNFTVPVPKTELGGMIITFLCVKPEETLASQPHPILSEPWGLDNFVADELALDPVPVTYRELDSGCRRLENTIAFYTGLNAMKQNYVQVSTGT
jgi:hypothetical protein